MSKFLSEFEKLFTDSRITLKYVIFAWCEFFLAFAYNLFLVPNNLVTGGSGGIGIVLKATFGIEPALVVFIFCALMVLLSILFLDADQILPTLFVAIFYPLFIKITANIDSLIVIKDNTILLMTIFGGIVTGFFQGQVLKIGLNFGGLSVIAKVLYKYTKLSVTLTNAILNGLIVVIGGFVIGAEMVLYAIVFLIILRGVSERVVLGSSKNKTFKIVTNKHKQVENFIEKKLGHDVTIYDTYGAHDGDDKKLIMTVVPTSQFTLLRDYVKSVDKKCFIFITDTYALEGQDKAISKAR